MTAVTASEAGTWHGTRAVDTEALLELPKRAGPSLHLHDNTGLPAPCKEIARGAEMKELAAAIALLCVSSTVLAHDIYTNLRDRDGNLCCGAEDCMPVEATVLPDGNYYLPRTDEVIPADMATPSPDDRFHRCTHPLLAPVANEFDRRPAWKSTPQTRCFFAPVHSS